MDIYLYMINKQSKICILGHKGLVGSALCRELKGQEFTNIITADRKQINLQNKQDVDFLFINSKPEYVILAAAKVGGICANNTYPVQFFMDNIEIQNNVISACYKYNVKKLLFLGSSCIYPRDCPQPIKEEYLMSGKLEQSNSAYAIAKIAGIELCKSYNKQYGTNFICAMPTNLIGENDHYDLNNSHVFPALIRKFIEAKANNENGVILWGDGSAKREFLYSGDLAKACIILLDKFEAKDNDIVVNVGTGDDISIKELAYKIKEIVGYNGEIIWDTSKPNGTPRKLLDVSKINEIGWVAETKIDKMIEIAIDDYLSNGSVCCG